MRGGGKLKKDVVLQMGLGYSEQSSRRQRGHVVTKRPNFDHTCTLLAAVWHEPETEGCAQPTIQGAVGLPWELQGQGRVQRSSGLKSPEFRANGAGFPVQENHTLKCRPGCALALMRARRQGHIKRHFKGVADRKAIRAKELIVDSISPLRTVSRHS